MQTFEIYTDEIIIIEEVYIVIVADEEMARTYVDIVEVEEKEIQKTVDEVTILFE